MSHSLPPHQPTMTKMKQSLSRVGPIVTPVVVIADVALVASGVLSVRNGVMFGAATEALVWVLAISRAVIGVREYRHSRQRGVTLLRAVEDGLAKLVPRKVAHVLLLEPQLWKALALFVTGRATRPKEGTFSYWQGMKTFMLIVSVWSIVEFVGVSLLVGLLWGDHWWAWLIVAIHAYGIVWLLGLLASFVTTPHRIEDDEFVLADGCLLEGRIKLDDIESVHQVKAVVPGFGGRTGLQVEDDGHTALIAFGPNASVRLSLRQGRRIEWWGRDVTEHVRTITFSADNPQQLVATLRGRGEPPT